MRFAYEDGLGVIHWLEQPFSAGAPPAEVELYDGRIARRCYKAEQVGVPASASWPMTCLASGVHPDQAQELRDELKRQGVPTDVTPNGDPVYVSAEHRRRALKARGMHDRASYY